MGWALAAGIASAIFGGFNAYDEYHANRRIRRDLEEIKKYLAGLDVKIDEVISINRNILTKLDELPEKFREIIEEVQSEGLLEERYSTVRSLQYNFLLLRGGRRYRINGEEWLKFMEAMTYLYEHEYRPSRVFQLIQVAEVALVVTKERAFRFVEFSVISKRDENVELKEDALSDLEAKLASLKAKLDNKKFISSHNLDENLTDINELEFKKVPDRNKVETYWEEECHWVDVPGRYADRQRRVCENVKKTRTVPDKRFHDARDKHVKKVRSAIKKIRAILKDIRTLNGVIQSLDKYIEKIGADTIVTQNFPELFSVGQDDISQDKLATLPMYFEQKEEGKVSKSNWSEGEYDDFDDYIDGCHGDCESIKGLDIQNDNPSFVQEIGWDC